MISACIIGAGAAGLCALRQCLAGSNMAAVAFEQSSGIGGTWLHSSDGSVHSSLYDNLTTNLPKEIMAFPDFPFPPSDHSYLHHTEVLRYLNSYADHFHLRPHIRLNTTVVSVNKTDSGWTVVTLQDGVECEWQFDAIFVCNGHFSEPRIPEIANIDRFQGEVLHSHSYRSPVAYKDKIVACIGAGFSGIDIATDLSKYAAKVYLCHRRPPITSKLPANIEQKPTIVAISDSGKAILSDQSQLDHADVILFCTGYHYHFPFFHPAISNVPLNTTNNRVTPVYQHLVHIYHPSLFLVGLNFLIVPFPFFHVQIQFCLTIMSGGYQLPSVAEMLNWEADDYHFRLTNLHLGIRQAHLMSDRQYDYLSELANSAGFPMPIPPVMPKLLKRLRSDREGNLLTYKTSKFRLLDENNFVEITDVTTADCA